MFLMQTRLLQSLSISLSTYLPIYQSLHQSFYPSITHSPSPEQDTGVRRGRLHKKGRVESSESEDLDEDSSDFYD